MTEKTEAPAGQGEGAQVPENSTVSSLKDSASSSGAQVPEREFRSLVPPDPPPWPEPVDGVEMLDALVAVSRRHLYLPEGATEAMALWVVHTHAFKAAEASPRLALISPLPECGKTTALSLLDRLVARPLIASNVTTAALYRVIERDHPTLLVDELDSFMDMRDELAGIMNSGHTRQSAYVVRCVGEDHEPAHFSTWAPLAIARIGDLPPALRSRSIVIEMQRARPGEEIERLRPIHHPGLDELARKAARWARDNLNALRDPDPKMPGDMSGRTADNWRALLAIADRAGGHWPELARCAAVCLSSGDELSPGVELLAAVLKVFNTKGVDRLSSDELSKSIGKSSEGILLSPRKLARALKPFGIRPRVIRIGDETPRGYMRAKIEDVCACYLRPPADGSTPPP